MAKKALDPKFLSLLAGKRIASLGSLNDDGSPHLTAVWYLYQDGCFFVATSSRTRKARNLFARPHATIMVESRKPGSERGVTATGPVEIISGEKAQEWNTRIHRRYLSVAALADPQVGPVFAAFDDICVRLQPQVWTWWDMAELDAMALGGRFASNPGYLLAQEL
jgi:PPOX class probable F420-dependent enzyme